MGLTGLDCLEGSFLLFQESYAVLKQVKGEQGAENPHRVLKSGPQEHRITQKNALEHASSCAKFEIGGIGIQGNVCLRRCCITHPLD